MLTIKRTLTGSLAVLILGMLAPTFARETQGGCEVGVGQMYFTPTSGPKWTATNPPLMEVVEASQNSYTIFGHLQLTCPITCGVICSGLKADASYEVWLWSDSPEIGLPNSISVRLGVNETFPVEVLSVDSDQIVRVYASTSPPGAPRTSLPYSRELKILNLEVQSFWLDSGEVVGGDNVDAHVSLNHTPAQSTLVSLFSNDGRPPVVGLPQEGRGDAVLIEVGQKRRDFSVSTYPVSTSTEVVLGTSYPGPRREVGLTVLPSTSPPDNSGPALLSKLVVGGASNGWTKKVYPDPDGSLVLSGYVEMTGAVPSGGAYVTISHTPADLDYQTYVDFISDDGTEIYNFAQAQIYIPQGESSASFQLRVYPCRWFATNCECDSLIKAEDGDRNLSVHLIVETCESTQANPATASAPVFRRGDANSDGRVDISDAMAMLNYLFTSDTEASCAKAMDVNDDARVDISDPMSLLNHLFVGERSVPAPFDSCGFDPTADELPCTSQAACAAD